MKFFVVSIIFLLIEVASAKPTLKFIGDFTFSTGEMFKNTEIGGLSGLVYDNNSKRLLAISDDRSSKNNARFYEFDLKLDAKSISVTPAEVVILKDENGKAFAKNTIDFEGITIINNDVYVSSEGSLREFPPIPPELLHFSRQGQLKERLKIPDHFLPNVNVKEQSSGVRDNLAFEALSTSPDGKITLMGMESALIQDGEIANFNQGAFSRIIKYVDQKPVNEYVYPVDKVPAEGRTESIEADNGLVDIAMIDNNSFFSLERSYLPKANKNVIKIFKVQDFEKAQDVMNMSSIKDKKIRGLSKVLVLDLESIVSKMNSINQKLDNIEGICFGPELGNGHRSLILVSDNNFSKMQRTLFLAFELIP